MLELFKSGTHTDSEGNKRTITDDDLKGCVASYNKSIHESPIVVGHPKSNGPAYGWVDSLAFEDGVLKAQTHQVDTQFKSLVDEGKYKKISASFYLPDSPVNPTPGKYYLRHVGFLGAQPPAVKGLKDAVFQASNEGVVVFGELDNNSDSSLDSANPITPQIEPNQQSNQDNQNNLSKGEQELMTDKNQQAQADAAKEAEIAALKEENNKLQAQAIAEKKAKVTAENTAFCETLITEGKLLPKNKEQALALLNVDATAADFSEDSQRDKLKAFMTELPTAVDFKELSKDTATKDNAAATQDHSTEYAEGTDPADIEMDQKIKAHMAQHNCSYQEAYNQLY